MSRVQLAINVTDLDKAVAFYSRLFGTAPAKVKPGYANFAIADPPLKLVLFEGPEGATLNHLGVEVETAEEVASAERRLRADGLETTGVEETVCCFAVKTYDLAGRPRRCALGVVRQVGRRRPAREDGRGPPCVRRRGRRRIHDLLFVSGATAGT